jgi:O-antigen/teichoic acid export membrane protein
MIKNIINTVFVRVFGALITLIIVIINSNQTGAEGLGVISLIILAISIFVIVNGFASGSLVYFIPRENIFKLLMISYFGVIITLMFFAGLMKIIEIAPNEFYLDILILSVIVSLSSIHEKILIGKERISWSNIVTFIKFTVQLTVLLLSYYVFHIKSVQSYIISLYFSYSLEFVLLFLGSLKHIEYAGFGGILIILKSVFRLSAFNTLSLIIQKFNYRLSYWLIEYYFGLKILGYFSAGIQISESTLIIARSVSFVQYSKISNQTNLEQSAFITILFVKLMFLVSAFVMLILSFIPNTIYSSLFGEDFIFTQNVIISLSLGIIALSCTTVISPFFSGTGNQKRNAQSALFGFLFTILGGVILIPFFGLPGAGVTTTLSYIASFFYQIVLFKNLTSYTFKDFFIKNQDIRYFFHQTISFLKKKGKSSIR